MFGKVCKTRNKVKLATELISIKKVQSAALKHGKDCESKALSKYVEDSENSILQSIVVSLEKPFLACSPDALVGDSILVEVKCP